MIDQQLARALFFKDSPKYRAIVNRAIAFSQAGKLSEAQKELSFLPDDSKLLETLYKKLQTKSVGTNIQKILEGKVTNKYAVAKSYSSIITHLLIEAEKGNEEFMCLFQPTISKLHQIIGD